MKYKDLRMLIVLGLFETFVVGAMCYFMVIGNFKKVILGGFLLVAIMMILLTRFNCQIFEDSVMFYESKLMAFIPMIIYFDDIKSYELLSKHKVRIKHKTRSIIYVLDANEFYDELDECYKDYIENKEKEVKEETSSPRPRF